MGGGGAFELGMKEKWKLHIQGAFTEKQRKFDCLGAPCIDGLVPTSLPKLGTPSSDSAPVFSMLKT